MDRTQLTIFQVVNYYYKHGRLSQAKFCYRLRPFNLGLTASTKSCSKSFVNGP